MPVEGVRLNFHGQPTNERVLRAGFIGCGSHAFRNVYPTLQWAPVELVATCDLDAARAQAFASAFGASRSYQDHRSMLQSEDLDVVFVVTSADDAFRPRYPQLAVDCLDAGCHVWIEKPPAATCADVESMMAAAQRNDRVVMVGFKKMFSPANIKAHEISQLDEFGRISLVRLEYPQRIPTTAEMQRYFADHEPVEAVLSFLDHLCHPVSLLLFLNGPPQQLYYQRTRNGAGVALFRFADGSLGELACSWGNGSTDGLERTVISSDAGRHVVVDNNLTVSYHRLPFPGYGDVPDFFGAGVDQATVTWRPEFSLGQLYNKGLFVLGYYNEITEFCASVLEGRQPARANLQDAWRATRIFEAFAEGPDIAIDLHLDGPVTDRH